MTLTDFLLARIAEDEALAQATLVETYPEGRAPNDGIWTRSLHEMDECEIRCESGNMVIYDEGGHSLEEADHIARHDPARVLAECEAKRRIVDRLSLILDSRDYVLEGVPEQAVYPDVNRREASFARSTLGDLALPYADHPDYREKWKP